MEITEVKIDRGGRLPVRVDLADMDEVRVKLHSHSPFECQPFAVDVVWRLPYRPTDQPQSVNVRASRVLKSGALGDTHTVPFYNLATSPAWLQSAVEAARPRCDIGVIE